MLQLQEKLRKNKVGMNLKVEQVRIQIEDEFHKKAPNYYNAKITVKEKVIFEKECFTASPFDPYDTRKQLFLRVFHEKSGDMCAFQSNYGKIIALFETPEQKEDIPWELWFRILRLFYKKEKPYTVFFLANTHLRRFPDTTKPIRPENINGGYTYPCHHDYICIYRAEDATRVLIHELFHASCSDNHTEGVDIVEAKTEAWAELVYQVLLAKGTIQSTYANIRKQSAWMRGQNSIVKKHMKSHGEHMYEFPWRYTIGKEEYWKDWGILDTHIKSMDVHGSLRLTPQPTKDQRKEFDVSNRSTIL